ncbi:hypothetical protein ACIGMX_16270 [Streptomyces aquilus]|uniref:hypothetical protein n=1 Tax=Streptomyces aquilus TaxID=2548456 RepID=UPI0037CF7918
MEKAQLSREQDARKAEREQARLDRRESFELTHLGDLHTALHELITTAAAFHKHLSESETIPPEARDEFDHACRKVKSLAGLVLDDSIREAVDKANDTVGLLGLGEPTRHGMPTKTIPQAMYDLGRAEYAVAAGVREIYKSEGLTERKTS